MKNIIALIGVVAAMGMLSGCSISKADAQKMSPAEAYYCAVDGGANYAMGIWRKNDFHGYCRERVGELEKSGQMLDTDKVQALRAGAGY